MASTILIAAFAITLLLTNVTLVQACSATDGDMTIDLCVYDAGILGNCRPNNKYGYLPEGFVCVLEPNTINCNLECRGACGDLMHNLARDFPNGLPNTSLSSLKACT
uniref:Uncharacterized protein n=1 Tax=Clytia hemisphaerica TaxID=252671 RepID=A0A7M5WZN3_9CNID